MKQHQLPPMHFYSDHHQEFALYAQVMVKAEAGTYYPGVVRGYCSADQTFIIQKQSQLLRFTTAKNLNDYDIVSLNDLQLHPISNHMHHTYKERDITGGETDPHS